jgi:hypothetical protein
VLAVRSRCPLCVVVVVVVLLLLLLLLLLSLLLLAEHAWHMKIPGYMSEIKAAVTNVNAAAEAAAAGAVIMSLW